jgi:hypothetical protein
MTGKIRADTAADSASIHISLALVCAHLRGLIAQRALLYIGRGRHCRHQRFAATVDVLSDVSVLRSGVGPQHQFRKQPDRMTDEAQSSSRASGNGESDSMRALDFKPRSVRPLCERRVLSRLVARNSIRVAHPLSSDSFRGRLRGSVRPPLELISNLEPMPGIPPPHPALQNTLTARTPKEPSGFLDTRKSSFCVSGYK